jgi:hypothetical protein
MKTIPSFLSIACALSMFLGVIQTAQADAVYTVRQTFTLKDVPEGGKQVRGWFWMPEDRPGPKSARVHSAGSARFLSHHARSALWQIVDLCGECGEQTSQGGDRV